MSFNDEDIIIFDNTQSDNLNQYTNSVNDYNDDIPPEIANLTLNPSQLNSEFKLVDDLFFDASYKTGNIINNNNLNEQHEIDEIIEIYKNTYEKSGEFLNISFRGNLLPISLSSLIYLTELKIINCVLDEITYTPPNLEKLTCNNCKLKIVSCKDITTKIKYINFSNNEIELITDFEHLKLLKYLNLDNNHLTYINDLPESMEVISLKNNLLTTTDFLMHDIRELYISNNRLEDIEYLLDSIEVLDISKNNIGILVTMPLKLRILIAFNCKINKIMCNFPSNLEKIDLYNNILSDVPEFNNNMKWADLSSNDLRKLPENIINLDYLDVSSNPNLAILPNNQNWKDFMQNMHIGKQFMMDLQSDDIENDNIKNYQNNDDIYISSDSENLIDDVSNESNNEMDENFKEKILKKYDDVLPTYNDIMQTTNNSMFDTDSIWNNLNTPKIEEIEEIEEINESEKNNNVDKQILDTIRNIRFKKQNLSNDIQKTVVIKCKRYVKKTKIFTI